MFLIYGRREEAWLREAMDGLLQDMYPDYPGLRERIHVFGLLDYGAEKWLNPATAGNLKLRVKSLLAIEGT